MTTDAVVAGGIVTVALGAFQLVRWVISRQSNGKKHSIPPGPDCRPCNDQMKELATSNYLLVETMKEGTSEQRELVRTFREWLAEEKGRRDAMRQTGEFPIIPGRP